MSDLDASSQVFDPQFSWTPVPGAASYDIEINRDASFSGTPAFTQTGVIGTSLTPQTLLPAATSTRASARSRRTAAPAPGTSTRIR